MRPPEPADVSSIAKDFGLHLSDEAVASYVGDENPLGAWYVRTEIDHADDGKLRGRALAVKDSVMVAHVPLMHGTEPAAIPRSRSHAGRATAFRWG